MPDVADLDEPDLAVVADAPEGPDEVARFDRAPGPRGEYEPGFWPGRTHVDAVEGLAFGLKLERLRGRVEQRQASFTSLGLDRREEQLAADPLQLLADMDRSAVEVDVIPAQAEHLPAPQAVEDEQDERRVQRVRPGGGEESAGLVSSPWADLTALPLRQLDQAGDVAHDEFFADRAGERGAEHGAHDLHLADGVALLQTAIQELLDHRDRQAGELPAAQARLEVEADDHLVQVVGGRAPVALDEVLQPVVQVGPELPHLVGKGNPGTHILLDLGQFLARLGEGLAVDRDALARAGSGGNV